MNREEWNAIAGMLAQQGAGLGAGGPAGAWGAQLSGAASNTAQNLAVKKQKEEEKKAKKAGIFGKIGSTLGALGGIALAPATLGTSLAATAAGGAIGSAVGGGAGELLAGQPPTFGTLGEYALQGGLGAGMAHVGAGMLNGARGAQVAGAPPASGGVAAPGMVLQGESAPPLIPHVPLMESVAPAQAAAQGAGAGLSNAETYALMQFPALDGYAVNNPMFNTRRPSTVPMVNNGGYYSPWFGW